ncbi:hypothetical protein BN1723_014967, partial [Verticillium longisporum]
MGAFPQFRLLRLPLKIIRMVIDHLSQSDTISLAQTGRAMVKVATHSIYFKDRDSGRQWALNLGCDLGLVDLVQKAIEYRYDLNRLTDEGVPLSRAVRHTHLGDKISVVEMLLRNGADPSLGSSHPLLTHFAQDNGLVLGHCHTTIPTLLLTHGARPSAIESSGIRLINLAIDRADNLCCHSHGPVCVLRLVQLLLRHGASANRPLFTGSVSPLVRAMCSQHRPVDLFHLLLNNGADPGAASDLYLAPGRPFHLALDLPRQPQVPLKWAILYLPITTDWDDRMQMVKTLLIRGARGSRLWRNTVLHDVIEAAGSDESAAVVPFGVAYDLCALLLQSGANPNCVKGGEMPLQKLASAHGFNEKDRMLLAGLLMAGGAWE